MKYSYGKLKKKVLLMVCLCFAANHLWAQIPQVTAKIDTLKYLIGQPIHLVLKFQPLQPVIFPDITDSINGLEILEIGKTDTFKNGYSKQITLAGYDSAYHTIPPFYFHFKNNGKDDSIATAPIRILVSSVPVDTMKAFMPIKPPLEMPVTWNEYFFPILFFLWLVIGVGLFIYFAFIKKSINNAPVESLRYDPSLPPHVEALKKLVDLEKAQLWQQEQIKLYYTKLSDIIRLYIERQFNIDALESTTDELMDKLKKSPIQKSQKLSLRQLLANADLVKFAKAKPETHEHDLYMKIAFDFVKQTSPQEPDQINPGK